MSKSKKTSETKVVTNNTSANRIRRINKHLKKHPNDEKAVLALTEVGQPRKASQEKLGFLKAYKPSSLGLYPQITKDVAHKLCQYDRLVTKSPFRPVVSFKTTINKNTKQASTEILMLHTSHLSNFKGASTKANSEVKHVA